MSGVEQDDAAGAASEPRPRDVLIYSLGQLVSSTGGWMQRAGMGWLVWTMTHSPAWVGALAFTDMAALLLISPWSGVLTDRLSAFRVLLITQGLMMAQALTLFAMVATGHITIAVLLGLALIDSCFQALNQPARLTAISLVTPPKRLAQGVAANAMSFNIARIIGPAIAGAIMLSGAVAPVFAANAASGLAMMIAVFALRSRLDRVAFTAREGVFAEAVAGVRYVFTTPRVVALFLFTGVFSLLIRPVTELLPAIAGQLYHGGPALLSAMMSAQGVGAMLGAAFMLRLRSEQRVYGYSFAAGLLLAVAVITLASNAAHAVAIAAMGLAGVAHVICNVGAQSLLQLTTDASIRGRVVALYGMLYRASPAFGAFAIGIASEFVSFRWLLVGAAVVGTAALTLVWRKTRKRFAL